MRWKYTEHVCSFSLCQSGQMCQHNKHEEALVHMFIETGTTVSQLQSKCLYVFV